MITCLFVVLTIFLTHCMCCNMSHNRIDPTNCPCRYWECRRQPHCRHKRSVQDDETDIFTDLCNFNTYDIDENGEISLDELLAISGRSDESQRLFLSLDNEKEDGVITLIEFTAAAPMYIKGCKESDKVN
ncbi:uncharacterized protein LOC132751146 isoform X2 [Ruditapes philippinarum]|uniref:uncharacterized protein LOC132751146 isoform X2 n=1 Tax=Ruditapes philippinarum TaxID=129788 RepID=UPI00295B758F|nr:uncharacterized protein LOC132751146 isoform X2 [Ruditapes philippinarum]